MATTQPYPDPQGVYTLSEAIDYMRQRYKVNVTGSRPVRWVSVRTGLPVHIGYSK